MCVIDIYKTLISILLLQLWEHIMRHLDQSIEAYVGKIFDCYYKTLVLCVRFMLHVYLMYRYVSQFGCMVIYIAHIHTYTQHTHIHQYHRYIHIQTNIQTHTYTHTYTYIHKHKHMPIHFDHNCTRINTEYNCKGDRDSNEVSHVFCLYNILQSFSKRV